MCLIHLRNIFEIGRRGFQLSRRVFALATVEEVIKFRKPQIWTIHFCQSNLTFYVGGNNKNKLLR